MDDTIKIVKIPGKNRSMIFNEGEFIGAFNSNDLERLIKDGELSLIDFMKNVS